MDSPGNVSVTNSPREKSPGQMTTGPNASERQPSPNKPTPGGGRPRPPRPTKPPIAQKPAVPVKPSCISPPKPSPNVVPKRTPPPLPSTPPRGNVRMSPRAGLSPKVSPKPNTAAAAAAKLNKSAEDLTESRTTNSLNDKPHEKDTSEEKRTKNFNNNDITKKSAASDSEQNVNVDTKASLAISLPNKNEKDKLVDTQKKALTDNHVGPTKISDNLEQCVSRDVSVNSIEATRSEQVTGKSAICFTPPSTPTSPLKSPRSPDHIYSEISEVRTPNKQSPCKPTAGAEPDKHEKASKSISDRERLNAKDLSASILAERSNDRTLPRRPVPKSRRSIVSNRRSTDGDSDFSSDSSYLMEMMTPSRDDVPDNQVTSPTSTDVSVSESTIVSPSTSFESSVTDNSKSSPSKSLMESISSQLKSVDNSSSVLSTESPKQSKKPASKKEAAATTPDNTCDMLKEIEDLLNKKFAEVSVSDEPEKEDVSQQPDEAEPSQTDCAKEVVGRRHTMGPDHFSSTPLRPPRPKRAASKIKQQLSLQMDSGSGGSTESLDSTAGAGGSGTLKRKCPPKPKRTTLPRVGRTQSDVTGMKNYMDEFANRTPPPPLPVRSVFPDVPPPLPPRNKTMTPINHAHPLDKADPGVSKTNGQAELIKSALEAHKTPNEGNIFVDKAKPKPVRKAPPPPERPPLESRLRSHQAKQARAEERKSLQSTESAKPRKISNQESKGFLVSDSQQDPLTAGTEGDDEREADQQEESKEDVVLHNVSTGSSDHDYHEIPDSLVRDKPPSPRIKKERSLSPILSAASKTETPPPPPQLPPRTYMETNSPALSSEKEGKAEGKDTQCQSSESGGSVESTKVDAVSGSGDDDQSRPGYLDMSGSSTPPSDKSRPISNASQQSSCNSENGSSENVQNEDLSSASDSENEDDEILNEKRKKKAFMIAKEIMTSEMVFVDVLQLLNVDFRVTMSKAAETADKPVVPNEVLNKILDYLPQLQNFNEDLLRDLNERVQKWNEYEKVADIFVKKGPFLKMYSSYIKNFENATANLDEACKKYPAFATAVRQFESTPRCASLALKHYMLKPIQRIPQYKLLLQDYLKHLTEECGDYQNTINALAIVSKVADHANQSMRQGDEVQKLMEIQHSLIGSFEVILPGRVLLKSGELMKLSRKELQPRMFFLFNDVLLYTVPSASGYKLNNILPLPGMRVSKPVSEDFKNEFNILSIQRSFTVAASTPEERDDWMTTLSEAIEDLVQKRNTFEPNKAAPQTSLLDKDFVVGHKAPLMVPDARVTMCMLCLAEFTITWRRHHCRACGRVVCGNCSENKAPLRYLKYKPARVCEECYLKIEKEINESSDVDRLSNEGDVSAPTTPISLTSIKARFQKIRKSARSNKGVIKRPAVLKEVRANDEGSDMSGYLKCYKNKKWKKMWYVLKDKVLYTYKASEDMAAVESLPLLGYEVLRETMMFEGIEPDLVFQLSHSNTQPHVFRTDSAAATTKWINVMRAASVA